MSVSARRALRALSLLGCLGLVGRVRLGPDFPQTTTYQWPEITLALTPSPDGSKWLVVGSSGLRVHDDLAREPVQHLLASHPVVDGGWLDATRVFVAYNDLAQASEASAGMKVETWNDSLGKRALLVSMPAHRAPLAGRMIDVSPDGRFIAEDSAVYEVDTGRLVLDPKEQARQTVHRFVDSAPLRQVARKPEGLEGWG